MEDPERVYPPRKVYRELISTSPVAGASICGESEGERISASSAAEECAGVGDNEVQEL